MLPIIRQCGQEGSECRGFFRREVAAEGRHIAASLDDLSNELVTIQAACYTIKCRAAFPATTIEHMAVSALLVLHDDGAL